MSKKADAVVEKDVVLIYIENKPAFFAQVQSFEPDHKPKWWHVTLLVLQLPITSVTWILRTEQINGEEFTMAGTPIRIEKVKAPQEQDFAPQAINNPEQVESPRKQSKEKKKNEKPARILSLGSDKNEE